MGGAQLHAATRGLRLLRLHGRPARAGASCHREQLPLGYRGTNGGVSGQESVHRECVGGRVTRAGGDDAAIELQTTGFGLRLHQVVKQRRGSPSLKGEGRVLWASGMLSMLR